ncbi:MAG: transposase [Thermodesulfobacteriota bacterium]|nr:transposase [Thermodesulfobacteriota bacterium]
MQRGNNRQSCFYTDEDYCCYLDWLQQYSLDTGCSVHAYVLMTNHVHLFLTPADADKCRNANKTFGAAVCTVRQPHISV